MIKDCINTQYKLQRRRVKQWQKEK
jgi:hypothetical protein